MNNMRNHLLKRITALVLAMVMVFSLASTAFAADISTEAPFDNDAADTAAVEPVSEPVIDEPEEVIVDVTDEEEPAAPAEEEPADEAPVVEETDVEEPMEDESVAEPTEEADEMEQADEVPTAEPMLGWTYDEKTKVLTYGYSTVDAYGVETIVNCKDAFTTKSVFHNAFQLPEGQILVGGKTVTIPEGIYYFDVNGKCMLPSEDPKYNKDAATKLLDCTGFNVRLIVTDEVTGVTTYVNENRAVKFTKTTVGTLALPVGELFNGGFKGQNGTVYFGEADGVIKTDTTKSWFHWCGEMFYLYTTKDKNGFAVGTPYTGSHKFTIDIPNGKLPPDNEVGKKLKTAVYFFKDGVIQTCDGTYHWWHSGNGYQSTDLSKMKLMYFDKSAANNGISVGTAYTGSKKLGSLPAELVNRYETGVVYFFDAGVPSSCDKTYHWFGKALYYFNNASAHKGFSVGAAYSGVRAITSLPAALKGVYPLGLAKFVDGIPTPFTGIFKASGAKGFEYYKDGVKTKYTGWQKSGSKYYYFAGSSLAFNSGASAAATKTVPGIGNTGKKYKFTFKTDGSVVTNLFSYSSANKAKKMRIQVDNKYHNTIFLLYNSGTKAYDIAALQVICSTPSDGCRKRGEGLAYGNYYLSTTRRWAWAKNSDQNKSYCKCTEIVKWDSAKGKYVTSGFMFHSPQYKIDAYTLGRSSDKAKQRRAYHMLYTTNYNKFGGSNTGGCVRLQTGYCALVQSISSSNKSGAVQVRFNVYTDKGPFGLVTNADIQIPASQDYDPTTPASLL